MTDTRDKKVQEELEILAGIRGNRKRRAVRFSDLLSTASSGDGSVKAAITKVVQEAGGGSGTGSGGGTGTIPPSLITRIENAEDAAEAAADQASDALAKANQVEADLSDAVAALEVDYSVAVAAASASEASRLASDAAKTAAQAARDQAQTKAGEASGSASAAAGSASLAQTSADDAADSASAAAAAVTEVNARLAEAALLPADMTGAGSNWTGGVSGDPASAAALAGDVTSDTDAELGAYITLPDALTDRYVLSRQVVPYEVGRTYRINVRARSNGAVTAGRLRFHVVALDSDHDFLLDYGAPVPLAVPDIWDSHGWTWTVPVIASATYLRFGIVADGDVTPEREIDINLIRIDDRTDSTASAASALSAAASQSAASASAAAASADRAAAQVAASAASADRVLATQAREDAEDAAASAQETLSLASETTARGIGVLSDPFLIKAGPEGFANWGASGSATSGANEHHLVGKTWTFTLPASGQRGMQVDSSVANTIWVGPQDADAFVVEVDFTLVSGSISGAGIVMDWNSAGADNRVLLPLSDMIRGTVRLGQVMTGIGIVARPTMAGTFTHHDFFFMAGFAALGQPITAKTLKIHAIRVRVAMAEEIGRGAVQAAFLAELDTNYLTHAETDSAIAAATTYLRASLEARRPAEDFSGGAAAWTQATTGAPEAVPVPADWTFAGGVASLAVPASQKYLMTRGVLSVKEGDKVRVTARVRLSGGSGQNFYLAAFFLDASFAATGSPAYGSSVKAAPESATMSEVSAEFTIPAGVNHVRCGVAVGGPAFPAGRTFHTSMIRAENISIVAALEATITANFATKVETTTAIANAIETYDASVAGGLSATVTTQATAIADIAGHLDATLSFRVKAGSSGALLELIATSDPEGSTSIARIEAANILLQGSVAMDMLAVGMNRNMLRNSNFADGAAGWVLEGSGAAHGSTTMTMRAAGQTYAGKYYPTLRIFQNSSATTGESAIRHRPFANAEGEFAAGYACAPDRVYEVSAQISAHRCTASLKMAFYDADGAFLSISAALGSVTNQLYSSSNPETWPRIGGRAVAPAGAAYACPVLVKGATISGGADSNVFLHKPQMLESHAEATDLAPYSQDGTTYINGGQIVTWSISSRHIQSYAINTEHLAAQAARVENLLIDEMLQINIEGGGFSFGKTSVDDLGNDGIYMGRLDDDGDLGFGFNMGRIHDGVQQYIRHAPDKGLQIVNASHRVLLSDLTYPPVKVSSSQTVTLSPHSQTLTLGLVGGGGQGAGRGGNGSAGGATLVQLYDGDTYTGISWTAPGGAGGAGQSSTPGQASAYAAGGAGGTATLEYSEGAFWWVVTNPTGGSRGSGGGGKAYGETVYGGEDHTQVSDFWQGGRASALVQIVEHDISGLSEPKLVITIGTGGNSGGDRGSAGGAGYVVASVSAGGEIDAGVVPLHPTATGSFSAPASTTGGTIFPDLGAGLWVLYTTGGVTLELSIVQIDDAGTQLHIGSALNASFVSNIRPIITSKSGTARTIQYAFYRMRA